MRRALAEYQVRGIRTTIPFFQWMLDDEDFMAARFDTGFIDRKLGRRGNGVRCRRSTPTHEELAAIAAARAPVHEAVSRHGGRPRRGQPLARRRRASEALR